MQITEQEVGQVRFPGGLYPSRCLWRQLTGTCALCPASACGLAPPSVLRKINVHICSASRLLAESSYSSAHIFFLFFFFPQVLLREKETKPKPTILQLSLWTLCGKQRWHSNSERNFPFVIFFAPFLVMLSLLLA